MEILGINFSFNNRDLKITEADRDWVLDNFKWLRDVLGYPAKSTTPILFSSDFFPATFRARDIELENIITDLCSLYNLKRDVIKVELVTDIRDTQDVPYEMGDDPFSSETQLDKGNHIIFVANSYLKHPAWLVHCLIGELAKIRLTEIGAKFDAGDDNELFVYLAAVYHNFGVLLANTMHELGRSNDGYWETRWNYLAKLPEPVMAFSLAVYSALMNDFNPPWAHQLKNVSRKSFEASLAFIKENVKDLYDEREAQAGELFDVSEELFKRGDNEGALATLQKILFLTSDEYTKSVAYNNIGYHYMMEEDYQQGISNFQKAMSSFADFAYPVDNAGYALIMAGDLESGLSYLQKAIKMEGNDIGYTYRNFALYHHRKNERDVAEGYFTKALEQKTPVDLLEYHYAEFLLDGGATEQAKEFFLKSVEKKEMRGISKARQLGLI